MDAMTRDLVIRLRWIQSLKSPLTEEMKAAKQLAREAKRREQDAKALGLTETQTLRSRWREARALGLAANRQERDDHRRRLKDLAELKARRAEAMGWVQGFGAMGAKTAMVGGAIGLAAGVGLTKTLIDEARSAQNEWLGMTTLINSADSMIGGPMANVNAAFKESKVLLDQLRVAAADTPGTFDDINTAFRDLVIPARAAGAEYKEIIKLASDMSTMSKVLGFDPTMVSQDVRTLLRGEQGDIITPQLNMVRDQVAQLARSGQGSQALAMIQRSLAVNPLIMKEFSGGFDAQFATLIDEWKAFAREAGKPVLDWLTKELKEALKWIGQNKDQVKEWAKALGEGVVDALQKVTKALSWMWENREEIIGWAKWLGGATGLALAVTAVNSVVAGIGTLIGLGPALGMSMTSALGPLLKLAAFMSMPFFDGKNMFEVYGYAGDAVGAAAVGQGRDWFFGANDSTSKMADDRIRELRELKALEQAGEDIINVRRAGGKGTRGSRARPGDPDFVPFQLMDASGKPLSLKRDDSGFFDAVDVVAKAASVTPNTNNDFRGSKFTINQRVETNNPAALARASLLAGYEAVAKRPIRAKQRPGSVRLANGDRE